VAKFIKGPPLTERPRFLRHPENDQYA